MFLQQAKSVLSDNTKVLYGIFGVVESSGYFPPRAFLNEFLMQGSDPCDQDRRSAEWSPVSLSPEEYSELKEWWISSHPDAVVDSLGVNCWDDWIGEILNR